MEARWAHNPKVIGSKPIAAIIGGQHVPLKPPCFLSFCYSNTFLFGFSLFLALEKERKYLINNVNATLSHSTVSEAPLSAQKIEILFFAATAPFDPRIIFPFWLSFLYFCFPFWIFSLFFYKEREKVL